MADRPLAVLPDGEPTEGTLPYASVVGHTSGGYPSPPVARPVAPDGSRIEFEAGGNLFSRLDPGAPQSALDVAGRCDEPAKACTVELDSSESSEPGGGGIFAGASGEDGSVVYFTDDRRLTSDATAAGGEPDLYEYDFRRPAGERLRDLTVAPNAGEHADVLGYVGTDETGPPGEYVYFVATGALASNPEFPQTRWPRPARRTCTWSKGTTSPSSPA